MPLPADYAERVYAGVLGKMIGVYLGRPFEGWTYERIMERLGEIDRYVHDELGMPLIVTDDDLSGTFTFIRALADYGYARDLTPAQIGQTWLNYLIEEKTILWWGGLGNATEHTAYLRLKSGMPAPQSGAAATNGKVVAEQIGAQIFIDGWGMIAPGDPQLAADFASRAASVSHDGEAIYGARVIAAMEAMAFVESDIDVLIDTALDLIPGDSVIHALIQDIRGWHARVPDWHEARRLLAARYGYDSYGGSCHMVPNHGLIIFSLLYGGGDFTESLKIVNTAGWDTDCNAGNLGCLLGIRNGLAGLAGGPDWRGPIADRLYLPTADGGRAITDAVTEAFHLVNAGRALQGLPPAAPKGGARFHFELPGAVQGFTAGAGSGDLRIENVRGHSETGSRSLAIHFNDLHPGKPVRVATPTFVPDPATLRYFRHSSYPLLSSPALYPGQQLRARITAGEKQAAPVRARLFIRHYNAQDELAVLRGEAVRLEPGAVAELCWRVPDTGGQPVAFAGLEMEGEQGGPGVLYLDFLAWEGEPDADFSRPPGSGTGGAVMWKHAWVDGLDGSSSMFYAPHWPEAYRLIQNEGRGLLIQGTREWADYELSAELAPHMCRAGGIAVRVQGMRRYYALILDGDGTRLVRAFEGRDTVLASDSSGWEAGRTYRLTLRVEGNRLVGAVDGKQVLQAEDPDGLYRGGAIALLVEAGRIGCDAVAVRPIKAGLTS